MEVHQHTPTPRKKWTHYFWEFFMLFLAVTLGFFVENQREHYVEHQREKQFIRSLIIDVKLDTASLHMILERRKQRKLILDSLSYLLNSLDKRKQTNDLYYYSRFLQRVFPISFTYNDRTIQQLKNSGGLRLIRNKTAADSIIIYDARVRDFLYLEERENNFIDNCLQISNRVFDGRVYDEMLQEDLSIIKPASDPPLLKTATLFEDEFNSSLHTVKSTNISIMIRIAGVLHDAESLLNTLKKEYHLN